MAVPYVVAHDAEIHKRGGRRVVAVEGQEGREVGLARVVMGLQPRANHWRWDRAPGIAAH